MNQKSSFIQIFKSVQRLLTSDNAGFEAQLVELKAYGCERMYQEQVSAVASRQELERAIDMLREGDKLVVTKLDRLGP